MPRLKSLALLAASSALVLALIGCSNENPNTDSSGTDTTDSKTSLVVYSSRKEHLIKPLFEQYTAKTGIDIQYITDKAGPLIQRLKAEGNTTPADIFMTVDVGNLWQASSEGLLQPMNSSIIEQNIPANYRDASNQWVGLSVRARTLVYSTERVQPEELTTYEALADAQWKDRLCLRTSKKVYNQSLIASMINSKGEAATEDMVKGWVANLVTAPFSNDDGAMNAILAGQCDVSIVNTYYFGRKEKQDPNIALKLFWPNQNDRGVHINLSGAGVTKYAKHPQAAQELLEWLSGVEAQGLFAELNQEFPANPGVEAAADVRAWGTFKADAVNIEAAGRLQKDAIKLMDRAQYK